jgi:hypothetical protein
MSQNFEGFTPKQVEALELLQGDQRHTCIVGGARSGKTFVLTYATVYRALHSPNSRYAIFRLTASSVRHSIARDTLPNVMRLTCPSVPYEMHWQDGFAELPNGAQIWLMGLDDKERVEKVLGMEFVTIYFNECSRIRYATVQLVRNRLAQVIPGLKQRAYYDINPTGIDHWTNQEFGMFRNPETRKPLPYPENYKRTFINPSDNSQNLSPEYLASLQNASEAYRRRFWLGQYSAETSGALWTYERLEKIRCTEVPVFARIVVAIDQGPNHSILFRSGSQGARRFRRTALCHPWSDCVGHHSAALAQRLRRPDRGVNGCLVLDLRIQLGAYQDDDRRKPHPHHHADYCSQRSISGRVIGNMSKVP